jgi:hypothetical protein
LLERRIVPSIEPSSQSPREVLREFMQLTGNGARIRCVGSARRNPKRLFSLGYLPRYKLELFGVTFYLCDVRQNEDVRFFPAYLVHANEVHARLIYKDGSLLWRCASHFAKSASEFWIGKGDLKLEVENGFYVYYSAEHTTDLPLEMQMPVEGLTQQAGRVVYDREAPRAGAPRGRLARIATSPRRAARRRTRATW